MTKISDPAFDDTQFRAIMRSMAVGVTVITTAHEGHKHGMTATAFSSVSADPPSVLIVLNRSTRTHPILSAGRHFVVNLLAEHQIDISQRFSAKIDDQFDGIGYSENREGIPVLKESVANLECEIMAEMDVGTHTIFIGKVTNGTVSAVKPLIYHDGNYKAVAHLTAA